MLNKVYTYSFMVLTLLAGGGIFTQSVAQKKSKPAEEQFIAIPKSIEIDTSNIYRKVVSTKKVVFEPTDEFRFRDVVDRALNDRVQDLDLSERVRKVGEYFLGVPYVDR